MADIDFWGMLGGNTSAKMYMEIFRSPSNIILTDNPPYTQEDFTKTFPKFVINDSESENEGEGIPYAVFNLFLSMANHSIKYDRFKSLWKYLMSLYIAHYCTLYLQTQAGSPNAKEILASAMPKGIATSKSVDGLSISYDVTTVANDFAGYGTYKNTLYGQQLITLSKLYGMGGMWVNGR